MLRFNYKGHTVAYMELEGVSMDDIKAARAIAADLAGAGTVNIRIVTDARGGTIRG